MKITLITGSYPPDICGVADYTKQLYESLQSKGLSVSIYSGKQWGVARAIRIDRELSQMSADLYHMQYPATGYGWKLGPQFVSLLRPLIVTIHECSQANLLRQISLFFFSVRARKIIFTNEYEQRYAQRFAPWIKKRSALIPIGNNVPLVSGIGRSSDKVIVGFGLIRPQKGLEQLIELGRLCKARANGLTVKIIGTVLPGNEGYFEHLRDQAKDLPITWCLGLTGESLSGALAEAAVAYLPFPDGASERRSSLIAMLSNGVATITTYGSHTPRDLSNAVLLADCPEKAVQFAENLYSDPDARAKQQRVSVEHAIKYSWTNIAQQHLAIYTQLLERDLQISH